MRRISIRLGFAMAAAAILLLCPKGGEAETAPVAEGLGPLQTRCIGRYLVDLPERFRPVEQYGLVRGVRVVPLGPGDLAELEQLAQARISALSNGLEEDRQHLRLDHAGRHDDMVLIRRHTELPALGTRVEGWVDEALLLRSGVMFRLEHSGSPEEGEAPGLEALLAVAGALSPRRDEEIPSGPGACLPGAFVALPPQAEAHGASFTLDGRPDPLGWQIDILMRPLSDPQQGMEDALPSGPLARDIRLAGMMGRALAPLPGQSGFGAVARSQGGGADPAVRFSIELFDERADPGSPPLTSAQAAALWSAVTTSVRARPD